MNRVYISILVIISVCLSFGAVADGDLSVSGTTTTNALKVSGLDCTAKANGGALTTDASGLVSCSDDDIAGAANTLDMAYDQGGLGAGRIITADSGSVFIQGTGGLDIDIGSLSQTPGDPVLIGSLGIGQWPYSIYVSGRYAYVTDVDSNDLKVIDVSDPGTPSLVGSLSIGTEPKSVYVSGGYAYVVDKDSNDLKVIDVSDPSAPSLVGSLGIGGTPNSVYVSGRYAYVADSDSNDLKVIDVSDPSIPSVAGSLGIGGTPRSVHVSGRYAYVVDQTTDDLKVIDVSDPGAPSLMGSLVIGTDPWFVYVSGRYAYVVNYNSDDLVVIDVSDPGTPSLAGSLGIGAYPVAVYVSGRYAYVIETGSNELKVIDVSDPSAPSLAGSLVIGHAPSSVYVSGRYAYVVDQVSDDLKVIDVSGAEVTALMAHSLEAGNLQVRNDVIVQGQLQVTSGVNVGTGGIFSDGNVGISGTVAIANDIAPTSSLANQVQLYAEDVATSSELKVRDEAGNITTLSPHNFSLIGQPSETMAWSFYSENDNGKINVDMLRALRLLEEISGQKLVHTELSGMTSLEPPGNVATNPRKLPDISSLGYKLASYHKMVTPLIEAVTELKRENDLLRAELRSEKTAMNRRLEALETRLNQ